MNRIEALYDRLRKKYGQPLGQWELWCKRPKNLPEKELVVMESILTQRANWKNVQLAVAGLRKAGRMRLSDIRKTRPEELEQLIRPSGFYRQKAERLIGLADFFERKYAGLKKTRLVPAPELREQLLDLKGVGPETADDILLYALEKPVFVIDEYTRRLAGKLSLVRDFDYHTLQALFEKNLRKDYALYQDFHALIVIDGKTKTE